MMKFDVSINQGRVPFHHFWTGTGFSPGSLLLNADMKQQMAYAGSIPFKGIRYVRIHYLLDLVTVDNTQVENPVYNWDILNRCIDVLIDNNLIPFFELMGNPGNLFNDFLDDTQIRKWKDFVSGLAHHFIERYGIGCVSQWYFETWNEPDGPWWPQGEQAFCNYYDACSEGLNEVSKELRFGGPGTCFGISPMYKTFLAHCDSGINYFTKKKGSRLDFISIHEKGAPICVEDVNPDSLGIIEREKQLHDYICEYHPRLKDIPLMNNECDPQVGWWDTHTWRGKAYHAAIAVKIINQHIESFIDRGIRYALLSNDNGFVGSWGRRTLMGRFGLEEDKMAQFEYEITEDEYQENPERRRFSMIKKPVLSVMTMLSFLGDERCSVSSINGDADIETSVIATTREDQQIALLIYSSRDKIMSSGISDVHIDLSGIPFNKAILSEYRIEEGYTDPFSLWEKQGVPQIPAVDLIEKMRDEAELAAVGGGKEIDIENGELSIQTSIPLPSVRLFLITADSGTLPAKVQTPKAEVYEGLDDSFEDVLLRWPCLDSYSLKTYEVLYRSNKETDFRRINSADTQCTLWIHSRKKGESGEYRIRALDFWDRQGQESDSVDS